MWSITAGAALWYSGFFEDDEQEEEDAQSTTRQVKLAVEQVQAVAEQEKVAADGGEPEATKVVATDGLTVDENGDLVLPENPPEDAWLIPLGWARKAPRVFYKGSDPEWKAFVKFSKDREKLKAIKVELANLSFRHISALRELQKFLGQPMQRGKYWLDVDFPVGPPQEYERSVLEISSGYIAVTTRPVKEANVKRLYRTLFPSAAAVSVWATWQSLWQFQVNRIRSVLNLDMSNPIEKPRLPPGFQQLGKLTGKDSAKGPAADQADATEADNAAKDPNLPPLSERSWLLKPLPSVPVPGSDISQATKAFKKSLVKNWKPVPLDTPRGAVMVSGLIEVHGPKGFCLLDVEAAYDPTKSHWDTVSIKLRRVAPRQQTPMGGR